MLNQETDNYFLKLLSEAEEILEKSYNTIFRVITITKGYFTKPTTENYKTIVEQNLKMPVISYKGDTEQEMKFQGKTIHKNTKCNTWYTRYRTNGKQIYISGKTQKEVLQELKSQLNYVKKEKKKTLTLLDWFNQWLELFKVGKVKQTTLKDYNKTLKNVQSNLLNKDITQITSYEILKNLDNIKFERTKQTTYELLNSLFKKAKDYEIVNKNVLDVIEKPKHVKEKGIALTQRDQEIFIELCQSDPYKDILLVTLYQGLRIGEALAITGNDIDIPNMQLSINKSLNSSGELDTTKNLQSNRIMPIFNKSIQILNKYIGFGNKRIFDISYNVPQKHLKKILQNTNLPNISLHDLRHTFITNCKNREIPEHIIQSWVGHNIGSSVTSRVYTHTNIEDTKKYLEKYNKSE